jgi:hypothetical protein
MPANMKKAGMSYKKGGSKNKKKTMYKKGGMKKMAYGGKLKKANWGQDLYNWTNRAVDNVGGFLGNVARDVSDPFISAIDWAGDADRSWVPGSKDLWNIRPDDYSYQQRGWNKPGWQAGNRSGRNTPPPPPVDKRGKSARNRSKWAAEEEYVPQSQRRSMGGRMKRYSDGGHVVKGKFLRQGPTRR